MQCNQDWSTLSRHSRQVIRAKESIMGAHQQLVCIDTLNHSVAVHLLY